MPNPYEQYLKQPKATTTEDRIRALLGQELHKQRLRDLENDDGTIRKMPYINQPVDPNAGPDVMPMPYRPRKPVPGEGPDYQNMMPQPYYPKKDPLVLDDALLRKKQQNNNGGYGFLRQETDEEYARRKGRENGIE
jgi:hypothetical protein